MLRHPCSVPPLQSADDGRVETPREAALHRQVRILHLFVTLPVGGAENLLLSIVRRLDSERFSSIVCCIGKRGVMGDQLAAMDIPVVELRFMEKGGMDRRVVPALGDLIRRERVDLVHSHLYHANLYGRLAARKAGVPAVVSIHNTYGKPKLHRRIINWYLGRHTAAIIVGSEDIRRDVERYDHVPASRIQVIPNCVDLTRSVSTLSKSEARARLGLAQHDLVIGTIGRLEKQKGHRYLIEALALLRRRGIAARLLLAGEGRERLALEALVAGHGLDEQVMLLGTRSDLGDLFRAMDIFVMPSLREGLSLVMLSAMAAGLPVVATSVGGVSQVLCNDEYGFTVPAGNAAALADKIAECLPNLPAAVAKGIKGARHVRDNYGDEAMVRRVEAVYERALQTGASSP
jgi:glycosyltransferase involved in cell wall biosynthesis